MTKATTKSTAAQNGDHYRVPKHIGFVAAMRLHRPSVRMRARLHAQSPRTRQSRRGSRFAAHPRLMDGAGGQASSIDVEAIVSTRGL
jgi:hypothetical protein